MKAVPTAAHPVVETPEMNKRRNIISLFGFLVGMLGGAGVGEADDRPVLQIINGDSRPIEIFWLKSDSERVSNGTAAPGDSRSIGTTIGHRFVIVGGDDGAEAEVAATLPVQAFRFQPPIRNEPVEIAEGRVIPRPEGLAVPSFYTKFISALGYPIVASNRVNDYALKEAAFLVNAMLAKRPDVRKAMIQSGSRLCIMAHDEFTTDLPEFQRLGESECREDGRRGRQETTGTPAQGASAAVEPIPTAPAPRRTCWASPAIPTRLRTS